MYPGDSPGGVLLAEPEEWDPSVPMNIVLSQIDRAENARADFETVDRGCGGFRAPNLGWLTLRRRYTARKEWREA